MTLEEIKAIQSNLRATFTSEAGKESMKFIEKIGAWIPTVYDSGETNEIIGRDANRRLIGTLKTFIDFSPEQIVEISNRR